MFRQPFVNLLVGMMLVIEHQNSRKLELPEAGSQCDGTAVVRGPSANVGFPSIGEGRVCLVRYHSCVRVLRTHTYRGGKKGFRDESQGFWGSI